MCRFRPPPNIKGPIPARSAPVLRSSQALGFRTRGPINFLTLTLSARADAVVDVFDVIIPNRYGPIRLEEAQADDFIHLKNPQFVEELDLRSTGFL